MICSININKRAFTKDQDEIINEYEMCLLHITSRLELKLFIRKNIFEIITWGKVRFSFLKSLLIEATGKNMTIPSRISPQVSYKKRSS